MTSGSHRALALTARVAYLASLLKGAGAMAQACLEGARLLASQTAEPALRQRRQDVVLDLPRQLQTWKTDLDRRLNEALHDVRLGRPVGQRNDAVAPLVDIPLTLVDDREMERELTGSRLAQAISDLTGEEFADLSARLQAVEGQPQTGSGAGSAGGLDVLSPAWPAALVVETWLAADLGLAHWATLQSVLHQEVSHWAQEAYHHANRVLLDHGVRPEIDLRPFIKRARDAGNARLTQPAPLGGVATAPTVPMAVAGGAGLPLAGNVIAGGTGATPGAPGMPPLAFGNSGLQPMGQPYDETRLLTQQPGLSRAALQSQQLMGQLNEAVGRQVPQFGHAATASQGAAISPGLGQAIAQVDQTLRARGEGAGPGGAAASPAAVLQDLQQSKQQLKQAASSPVERATIEIVALLFQSILMEERLPAAIRVWFARLQMPVLRVAVSEPDFFATPNHPARVLIDRMGACVMGFVSGAAEADDDALHKEIKRVVQVVEAYPDTGRRVFQTVLVEFDRFLERYFREDNEASKKGISLAQQVEQRETWAIQYTIELRKMLETVPVHEGVRDFLFKVWADVLAHSAVLTSQASDETRALKRAAADLIWSASAKTTREERAEVLRRLPPLLKTVREGMALAGLPVEKQDEHIQTLNAALAAAFSARSAAISAAHLKEVTDRLDALDEALPDVAEGEIDEQTLRDLSGYEHDELEIVAEGGSMPTPAMLGWARELQVGAWFQLDYRNRDEPVQLAWKGLHKKLILFVSPQGRGVLFQQHRLAAFLQAGLLVPAEDESLTTRATRAALAKLDADPARLLG
jgi:hypothetical protein